MCAQIVNAVDFQYPIAGHLVLNAEVKLLHHRVAHVVIDDIDAFSGATGARNDGASESCVGVGGRQAGYEISVAVKKVGAAEGDVDRQSATVESALEGFNFQRHPVVINAVTAVDAE